MSVCLVCDFSIVATCPSMPAARFAFCLCIIRFVFVLSGESEQNEGRGKLVQAPPPALLFVCALFVLLLFCLVNRSKMKGEGEAN